MAHTQTHADFRTDGFVSIWLGSIADENDLDDYLAEEFPDDFGFEIDPEDGPEFDIADMPRPISELLDGFSFCEDFVNDATAQAHTLGWDKAHCALVFYNVVYETHETNDDAPLIFIGAFPFGDEGELEEE